MFLACPAILPGMIDLISAEFHQHQWQLTLILEVEMPAPAGSNGGFKNQTSPVQLRF